MTFIMSTASVDSTSPNDFIADPIIGSDTLVRIRNRDAEYPIKVATGDGSGAPADGWLVRPGEVLEFPVIGSETVFFWVFTDKPATDGPAVYELMYWD